jgi:hypothetical protein
MALAVLSLGLPAHDVITTKLTWSREISRLIYRRCASCHREGGAAPMPLLTYAAARPWAKAIKEEVLERRMPPWGAVKGFGEFRDEMALTQEEIGLLAEWVEGGAPEGEPQYLAEPPAFGAVPASAPGGSGLTVDGERRLPRAMTVRGIRPLTGAEDARVVAQRPDGGIEPLVWLRGYQQEWARTFWLRRPSRLPANSCVRIEPPGAVRVELLAGR